MCFFEAIPSKNDRGCDSRPSFNVSLVPWFSRQRLGLNLKTVNQSITLLRPIHKILCQETSYKFYNNCISIYSSFRQQNPEHTVASNKHINRMVRLNTNVTLKGPGGGGNWYGNAIIDNGAPPTDVDNSVIRSLGERPNGKYCPGNGGNPICVIQPGYSLYDLNLKTDVTPYHRIEVAVSNLAIGASVLLGMD